MQYSQLVIGSIANLPHQKYIPHSLIQTYIHHTQHIHIPHRLNRVKNRIDANLEQVKPAFFFH